MLALALAGVLLSGSFRDAIRRPPILAAIATAGLLILASWAFAPRDLYPRFFIWLVPAVAVGVAWAVATRRWALPVAVALCVVQVSIAAGGADEATYANRRAGGLGEAIEASGGSVCVVGPSGEALLAYSPDTPWVHTEQDMATCDVVFALLPPSQERPQRKAARSTFSREVGLGPAHPDAVAFLDPAPRCITEPTPGCWTSHTGG